MLDEILEIPLITAATLTFDGTLTARDQSLLLAASWLAGRDGVHDGTIRIHDLKLRQALGNVRRLDESREFARYDRLERATLRTDERVEDLMDGADAPVVTKGMRRRTIGGAFEWTIDPAIERAFKIEDGDEVVGVPLQVLIQSRCRYTLPLLLRVMAWGAGEYPRKWLRRQTPRSLVLRIPVDALKTELGIPKDTKSSDILRYVLDPAQTEIISGADLAIDFEPVKAPSIRAGGGKVIAFDLMMPKVPAQIAKRHVKQRVFGGLIKRFPTKPAGPDDLSDDTPF